MAGVGVAAAGSAVFAASRILRGLGRLARGGTDRSRFQRRKLAPKVVEAGTQLGQFGLRIGPLVERVDPRREGGELLPIAGAVTGLRVDQPSTSGADQRADHETRGHRDQRTLAFGSDGGRRRLHILRRGGNGSARRNGVADVRVRLMDGVFRLGPVQAA